MTAAEQTKKIRNARDARNLQAVSVGDLVRYNRFGWTGVVVEVKGTRVLVSTSPGQTATWYRANVSVI